MLTSDQEDEIGDALIALDPVETGASLKGGAVRAIRAVLDCSDEWARFIVEDFYHRGLIQAELEFVPRSGAGHESITRLRWKRPTPLKPINNPGAQI